jgi:PAS domain S-box-containing protein
MQFSDEQIRFLFPFYFRVDEHLVVTDMGKGLKHLIPACEGKLFSELFSFKRSAPSSQTFEAFAQLSRRLVLLFGPEDLMLRGQFEPLSEEKALVFLGSPWFTSIDDLNHRKLAFQDFAFFDSQVDLLLALKNQEITNQNLSRLLEKLRLQEMELKKTSQQLHDMALFPLQSPDPKIRITEEGEILLANPAMERIPGFRFEGQDLSPTAFWKKVVERAPLSHDIWIFEAWSGNQLYNFAFRHIPESRFFNVYGRNITEQRQMESRNRLLSKVAQNNKNGVLFTHPDGSIFWCNPSMEVMSGYNLEELVGKTPIEAFNGPESDRKELRSMVNSFSKGLSFTHELLFYRSDKTKFWGLVDGQPVLDDAGEIQSFFAVIEDITEKKRNLERIQVLSRIVEDNINGVIISDPEGNIQWVNSGFVKLTGYTLEEAIGKKPGFLLQGEETNKVVSQLFGEKIRAQQPFQGELLNFHKSGRPYWARIQGQPLFGRKGEMLGFFAFQQDITLEKEKEEAFQINETRWRFALEGAGDGVWEYNFQTGESFFSIQYRKMLGYGPEDEFPSSIESFISRVHPEDRIILKETNRDYYSGFIQSHQQEFRMLTREGTYIWILDRGMLLNRTSDGAPLRIIGTHTDITDRKLSEQALVFNEKKYRNILANMNLGILEVDNDEVIRYANQSFCQMSGFEPEELMGKNARDFLVMGETQQLMNEKVKMRVAGISDAYEIAVLNKRGQPRWWLVSGAPNYDDQGRMIGSIGIHLDISEQKELQLELMEAREMAEASARAKETFLANMSHELRTPMHAITGMAALLSKTKTTERQKFFLSNIQTASDNMLAILNDILDLAKIESGKLGLEKVGFCPEEVLHRAIQVMNHRAEEKNLSLLLDYRPEGIHPVLLGDPHRINQILLNLLSNAIKFTEKGEVRLLCRLVEGNTERQVLRFEVQDTGVGMEKNFLDKLFDKFTQENNSISRTKGGTGLGMHICRELVDLMHGIIEAESEKGKGSAIWFEIPLELGRESELLPDDSQTRIENPIQGVHILLVDDNDMNRLIANTLLEKNGATVEEAVNGLQALDRLRDRRYDLVLMDIQMPLMDGLEATRRIREELHILTPVIALTANALRSDLDHYLQVGMNDCLSKPFTEKELLVVVQRNLGVDPESDAKAKEAEEILGMEQHYSLEALQEVAAGDQDFINKMIGLFIAQSNQMKQGFHEGLESGDRKQISNIAHKMKPSLDSLGVSRLKKVILELERCEQLDLNPVELRKRIDHVFVILDPILTDLELLLRPKNLSDNQ